MGAHQNATIKITGSALFVDNVATESGGMDPLKTRCFNIGFDVTLLAKIGTFGRRYVLYICCFVARPSIDRE